MVVDRLRFCSRVVLTIVVTVFSGCVTLINAGDSSVRVDSAPRGARVEVATSTHGTTGTPMLTPFDHRAYHVSAMEYRVDYREGHESREVIRCRYRWGTYIAGNSLLTVATLGVGVLGFAIDAAVGSPWDCPTDLSLKAPAGGEERTECRRILVLPARSTSGLSAGGSVVASRAWTTAVDRDVGPCDELISIDDTLVPLAAMGFSPDTADPEALAKDPGIARVLIRSFHPSHVAVLRAESTADAGERWSVTPRLVDLYQGTVENRDDWARVVRVPPDERLGWLSWRPRVRLSPNVLMLDFRESSPLSPRDGSGVHVEDAPPTPWASLLGAFSLINVESPAGKDRWSVDWRIFPAYMTHYQAVTIRDGEDRYLFTDFGASGWVNVGARWFIPTGTVTLSCGAGLLAAAMGRESDMPSLSIVPQIRWEADWSAITSKNVVPRFGLFHARSLARRQLGDVRVQADQLGFVGGFGVVF